MPDWSIWLIVAVILAFGELIVFTGFILGPLAGAAIVTAIVAALGASVEVQLAVFGVGGIAAILVLRPLAKKHLQTPPELRTNAAALVGQHARVLNPITADHMGLIRLQHENWSASPVAGVNQIDPETYVEVVEITGATAIVKPIAVQADGPTPEETPQGASQ
jgi:membrane protein implicated in regulation of membrane protease activity